MPLSKAEISELEAKAAKWDAIAPMLPEILQRGAIAAAKDSSASASGLNWASLSNADLSSDDSEEAVPEKLRRSVEAIEELNSRLPKGKAIAPTAQLLAGLCDIDERAATGWLMDSSRAVEIQNYTESLGLKDREAARLRNREAIGGNPREAIKWLPKYGTYTW